MLTARTMADMADSADLPAHEQRKLSFYARLAADTLAPSNYALTNPEVLERARETNGQSLIDGLRNLMNDLHKGYISTHDETAFAVGENLATSAGAVVFRNELIEIIQYQPTTEMVAGQPVLIVPPCVNKFYVFDLNEKKSMIRYLVEEGLPVFAISWRNPSGDSHDFGWDDYLEDGINTALRVVSEIAEADKMDLLSWCNGGTMLTAALAVMPPELVNKVATATFLSSLIDFSDPGELEVFIDRPQLKTYGQRMRAAGVAPGRDIARVMALLHANESVWNFVIDSYLMGNAPAPFDVLYWNGDTQNLAAPWFSVFLEDMYIKNLLKEPGALTMLGKPVDTHNVTVPCYLLAATEDHIVPWKSSYDATDLLGGDVTFVLTNGGHVSGTVINHPTNSRRRFHVQGDTTRDAEGWLASATCHDGSWWTHWLDWLKANSSQAPVTAPKSVGSREFPPLGPAPGTYVFEEVKQDG
ncbi:UNVERIFIED_CONTAM: hypothetical protein GTU68_031171 [Idotea baltica]|nr:hypothetical protein [Idotea baltica]